MPRWEKPSFSEDRCIESLGEINALLSHSGKLWVFKSEGVCADAICSYKSGNEYSLCDSISGVKPIGQALSVDNEIFFLSPEGLWSISTAEEETKLTKRSEAIEPLLIKEDLSSATLTCWRSYVAIGVENHIYLLDRRGGGWYLLADIGSHIDDRRVFRYSPEAEEGYLAHKHTHEKAEREVISLASEDDKILYYTEEMGNKYSVYPTSEREGGELCSIRSLFSEGNLLCFKTSTDLLIFNSDMEDSTPGKYSFECHAAKYLIVTEADNCGLPMTEKTSVGESLNLKIRAEKKTVIGVSILKDGCTASCQRIVIPKSENEAIFIKNQRNVRVAERIQGWISKQIVIEGTAFDSPIALSSISFKYLPTQKIKKG